MLRGIQLGCPFWGLDASRGSLDSADARAPDSLRQPARVFHAVEGNTTWLREGRTPSVFVHTPSNIHARAPARELAARLSKRVDVGWLPSCPGETRESASGQPSHW